VTEISAVLAYNPISINATFKTLDSVVALGCLIGVSKRKR